MLITKQETINKLQAQSNKYREINDELSSILQNFEDLRPPNIVVVGEQSAGKSSVLEYLSGVRFVTGQDMVTRCPLQFRMKYSNEGISKAIVNSARIEKPTEILNPESQEGAEQLDQLIREITRVHIGEDTVSNELIEVQVISPHVPDLTLVDLPGLITKSSKSNPHLAFTIRELVKKNMTEKDCILIVGDSGRDLQTIVGFTEAEEIDAEQNRTLCVLTKVDKCMNDKELVQKLTKSLRNEGAVSLVHGFVALKNRTSDETHLSISECENIEKALLDSLDAPTETKGRSALIEKLTTIQNDHLQDSIPKQKELLESKLCNIENMIEKTSQTIQTYTENGEEALIQIYEEKVSKLVGTFKDFSENRENFNITTRKDLMSSISENPLSLSLFSSVIDELVNGLNMFSQTTYEQVKEYYDAINKFLEKTKGFPGLPDLYQPTIVLDLVKLELCKENGARSIVEEKALKSKNQVEDILLERIVPMFFKQNSKLSKVVKSELTRNIAGIFQNVSVAIGNMFRREMQRTFTLDETYVLKSTLITRMYQTMSIDSQSEESKSLKRQFMNMGLYVELSFVEHLTKVKSSEGSLLNHNATIEILIKFKSYMNIVTRRIADQVSQLLYDGLIVTPSDEMKRWLAVKRINNKRQRNSTNQPGEHDQQGIPVNRIIEIMKPSATELNSYKKLLEKHEAIKKGIDVICRLDREL